MDNSSELSLSAYLFRNTASWVGGFAFFALIPLTAGTLLKGWSTVPQGMALFVQMTTFGIAAGAPMSGMKYRAIHRLKVFHVASMRCAVISGLLSTIGGLISILAARASNIAIEPTIIAHALDAARFLPWCLGLWLAPLLPLKVMPWSQPTVLPDVIGAASRRQD